MVKSFFTHDISTTLLMLAFRETGILVPFYTSAGAWIVGCWFPQRTFHDPSYTAWTFLFATVAALLHALLLVRERTRQQGHGASQHGSIWQHSFVLIPVVAWPLIFGTIAVWNFLR